MLEVGLDRAVLGRQLPGECPIDSKLATEDPAELLHQPELPFQIEAKVRQQRVDTRDGSLPAQIGTAAYSIRGIEQSDDGFAIGPEIAFGSSHPGSATVPFGFRL